MVEVTRGHSRGAHGQGLRPIHLCGESRLVSHIMGFELDPRTLWMTLNHLELQMYDRDATFPTC